jgi:hypothetical protein
MKIIPLAAKTVVIAVAISTLAGCADNPPMNFSVPNVGVSQKKIAAEVKSITVTWARPDEKSGDITIKSLNLDGEKHLGGGGDNETANSVPVQWQTALTESLNDMAIFQDDASKKVSLSVKILELNAPSFGISMTTTTTARYRIIDRKTGDIIFVQDIKSVGDVPASYAFSGAIRIQESINRAVQNNIALFLRALDTVDVNKPMFPTKPASAQ